jgi:DNA-binding transcriptional regulator YiaG
MTEIERIVDEIKQIRTQYASEVGEGRRAWPRSIRTRVDELEDHGVKPKAIAELTGVPYETVCYWRYNRKQPQKKSFHALAVVTAKQKVPRTEEKNLTVTVKSAPSPQLTAPATVTVTTPDGIKIEMQLALSLTELLALIRGQ